MRLRTAVTFSTLAALLAGTAIGCNQGTDVSLAPAPAVKVPESTPLPKDPKKGGGASSSGNMNRNPGAST
jgi:hypothetical protein